MRLFHSASIFCCYICTCIYCLKLHQVGEFFFKLNLVGATQLQCIYYLCRILISRPPRVFWRFKRRSCSLWQDRARSFWGIFSHPPTPKRSFGVLKLPILKEFDLLGPKFHFSLDLFGSNFQRPAAHPHQFSDRVPPPGLKDIFMCFSVPILWKYC